jgi:hypothetical protein
MQALGVDIQTIQSIVGHADTEMTLRMISMFRNPFGRVRSSCSARRFRPENWTERH